MSQRVKFNCSLFQLIWVTCYEYSRIGISLRISPSILSSERPQHSGHPHRKFSSRHLFHPSCLFSLLAKVRGAGDRLGDGSSVDCKWTQSIYKHKVHHTYHQNVRSLPLTFDLQRLSTLEGCTHREFEFHRLSADRPTPRSDGPGKLCILEQFGFRYVADFLPLKLLGHIAKLACKDAETLYTAIRPLSRDVFFSFLSEVPVTGVWAAQ